MSETVLVLVELPLDTARRLKAVAAATNSTLASLGVKAIEQFLSSWEWQVKAIEEGSDDIKHDRKVDHTKVKEWLLGWGTEYEKDRPLCK